MQDKVPEKAREYAAAHSRTRKWRNVVAVLSCAVVLGTAYALTRPAITMSQETFCGMEAHTHTDECYEYILTCPLDGVDEGEHEHTDECYQLQNVLACGLEEDAEFGHVHSAACYDEDGALICGQEETGHIHTDECYTARWVLACPYSENGEPLHEHTEDCYERYLICEKEEHQHSLSCYSDPHADLESEAVWEQTIPSDLGGSWAENVAAVAKSQLGYTASTRNYLVDDDGSMHGYTRYGAWFGYPYGEWCAMFASFCLHYAGVPQTAFPYGSGCIYWTELLTQDGLYAPAADYAPKVGDLAFFDTDGDALPDHVGVVTLTENGIIHTVEGNIANSVAARQHAMDESGLLGYGIVPESADAEDPAEPEAPLCGKEEHTHDDTCYDETGALICGLEEHAHTESCYTQQTREPLCGKEEHTHSDACYDESGALICGLEEHAHTESCYAQAGSTLEFTYADSELSMHVTVESPAPLAERTELSVQPADDLQQTRANMQDDAAQWIVRQIALTQDGEALDTSGMTMTAEITVQKNVLAPLYSSLTEQAEAAPEADAGITLAVMQEDGTQALQELERVTIAPDEDVPVLHAEIQSGTLVLYASSANPEFTVQYYAEIPRFDTSGGDKSLTIFDTSGGKLPDNKSTAPTTKIYLDATGQTTGKNAGDQTAEYIVATTPELTRMYTDNTFEYVSAPEPKYVDKLTDNEHYQIKELWVLKDGRDSASTNADDWDVYPYSDSIRFTNRQAAAEQDKNLIYIKPGKQTVLRLVYDAARADFTTPATFYDYDISSGQNSDGTWRTGYTGINTPENYGTSTNGVRTWTSYCDVLAFGNANCGTGMGNYKFDDIYLNRYSGHNYGCTFRLAKELQDGKIVYDDWLVAPKLFNDGDANGKHTYSGSSLTFQQVGDTYTLSSASVAGLGSITGLEKFFNPSPKTGTVHDTIYTNDFWPLDAATNRTDPLTGGSDVRFNGFFSADGTAGPGGSTQQNGQLYPVSDDGQAHNSFFGMQYAVEFTLTPDYVGPLEYTFFGDDDMWVFLDSQLVCDLGGVHSSVGEYVNLWDYLHKDGRDKTETHTLTIFYTERGASGSTCYMNFTLPSVSGVTIKQTTGGLMVYKEVSGEADPAQEFTFSASFTRSDGSALTDDHTCYRYDANGVRIGQFNLHSGGSFQLKAGEHLEILNLPVGTSYSIVETPVDGYTTTHTVNGVVSAGTNATGIIVKDTLNEVVFTNTRGSVPLHLQKLDQDGNPLSGAVFQLQNAAGETINVVKNGDGSYSAVSSAADVIDTRQLYYIAAAGEQSYVVGQNTSLTTFDAQLQKNIGADTQKLRVFRQADGSYSFQSVANRQWLDLDSGKLGNGTLIHFWENPSTPTTHDNQKWYLSVNSDGTFKIKPRVAVLKESNAVMDLSGGTLSEGQKIQAWAGNTSIAQKWLLIPVDPAQSPVTTQELEVSATGELIVTGLLPGSYTLTETKVPEGFRDSLGTVSVRIGADGKVSLTKPNVFVEADDTGLLLKVTNQHEDIDLTLEKQVVHSDTKQQFPFTITYTEADGNVVTVASPKLSGGASSGPFTIPYGVTVTIREEKHDGFTLTFYNGATLLESNGDSCTFRMTENVTITAVNTAGYALPSTGGGVVWYQFTGLLLLMTASLLYVSSLRHRRERGPQ